MTMRKNRALQEEQDMQDYNGEDEEDEPARPKKKKGTAVRRYTTVSAMCDPVLARLHARHVYIRGHPAAGVSPYHPVFPQALCCQRFLNRLKLPNAFPAGAAREGGLPATGPGAGNPGHTEPAALHDKKWCSVSCREPGDFRRACDSGKEGVCTAAQDQLTEVLFDALG